MRQYLYLITIFALSFGSCNTFAQSLNTGQNQKIRPPQNTRDVIKNKGNESNEIKNVSQSSPKAKSTVNHSYRIKKVMIDAGHGGKDPGAVGFFSNEKDINLKVALRLGQMLKDSTQGKIIPVYTRNSDWFPSLKERHQIANREKADLFISIHVNSSAPRKEVVRAGTRKEKYFVGKGKKKKAQYREVPVYKTIYHKETETSGTETFVLGLHRMDQKKEAIANREEGDKSGLMDMNDPTTAIIISQYNQRYLSKSVTLASKIQENYRRQGRVDRGVKQKGLEVLAGSAMPGVLVELGFINNRQEEEYLNTPKGIEENAHAIFKAIMEFATVK